MRSLVCALACALFLACAAPLYAQGSTLEEHQRRVAERYQVETWAASGPGVAGWAPDGFQPANWERLSVRIDARRAEAKLDFARRRELPAAERRAEALVTVQRHADPAAARQAFLAALGACAGRLEREAGLGEVAFGTRLKGGLIFLLGVRGDLTYSVRSLERDVPIDDLAAALDAELRQAKPQAGAKPRPRATLKGSKVRPPAAGQPIAVTLDFEGEVRALHLDAGQEASALRTEHGCLIYPEGDGPLQLEVLACDKELRVSRQTVTIR